MEGLPQDLEDSKWRVLALRANKSIIWHCWHSSPRFAAERGFKCQLRKIYLHSNYFCQHLLTLHTANTTEQHCNRCACSKCAHSAQDTAHAETHVHSNHAYHVFMNMNMKWNLASSNTSFDPWDWNVHRAPSSAITCRDLELQILQSPVEMIRQCAGVHYNLLSRLPSISSKICMRKISTHNSRLWSLAKWKRRGSVPYKVIGTPFPTNETLPVAQRTQCIVSVSRVISTAEIKRSRRDTLRYRVNALGPLCLWQCFKHLHQSDLHGWYQFEFRVRSYCSTAWLCVAGVELWCNQWVVTL